MYTYRIAPCLVGALLLVGGPAVGLPQERAPITFEDRTAALGVEFRHDFGGTGRRHLPETMGAGLAWLDFDRDGRPDLYLVDGGPLPGAPPAALVPGERPAGANALYRHLGTEFRRTGQAADRGWGTGVSSADFDEDGFPDLYVSNLERDAFYRNNGDGTFTEITERAGLGDSRPTSSSVWADFDEDGFLDLFVVSYVVYDMANAPRCGDLAAGRPDYCHPSLFDGQADLLYRNRGDGTFEDRSADLGGMVPELGKGLAAAVADLDGDGRLDIYVANDTTPNFVYLNRGDFRFEEAGVLTGAALGADGRPQAGMGVQVGDLDGDLRLDILVTNFAFEPYNFYRQLAPGFYTDDTFVLGFGATTLPLLGFGIVLSDFDADGDQDVALANGHVLREVEDFAQPNQVFTNRLTELRAAAEAGGAVRPPDTEAAPPEPLPWRPEQQLLADTTAVAGEAMTRGRVSRGMATADLDGDGLADLGVSNIGDSAEVLRNTTATDHRRVVLRFAGRARTRQAVGASVWVTPCADADPCASGDGVSGFPQLFTLQTSASFESQGTGDLHVGLGSAPAARIVVRWPGGATESWTVEAGRLYLVREGVGPMASRPLAGQRGANPTSSITSTPSSERSNTNSTAPSRWRSSRGSASRNHSSGRSKVW